MSKQAVFCIVAYITRANHIVDRLKLANFSDAEISVLFPASAVPATQIGGALGWLASIGVAGDPEIERFIATGPIVAALDRIKDGAGVGGIFGALLGVGLAGPEAKQYEERVKEGDILLCVHTEKRRGIRVAKKIFEQSGAQDVCITGDASSLDNLAARRSHRLEIAAPAASSWSPGPVARRGLFRQTPRRVQSFLRATRPVFASVSVQIASLNRPTPGL